MNKHMRKISFIVVIMLFAVAVTACGGGTGSNPKAPADEPNAANTTGESPAAGNNGAGGTSQDSDTVTYKAANGDIAIPKQPKRIVLVADYYGYFLTLGIKPVGVSNYTFQNPFYEGKLDGVQNIGDGRNMESILALQPDLILAWDAKAAEQLGKIAPTVVIEYGKLNYKDQLREFGRMTDTVDKAEAWIASWEAKLAEVKPKVQQAVGDRTVSIMQTDAKNIYVFGDKFGRGGEIIYGELGLKATELTKKETIDAGPGYTNISLEKLPEFAGDYIFTSTWTMDSDGSATYDSVIWKSLPAVKQNRVFNIHPIGYYFNDPISMEGQLAFIVSSLTQ